MLTYVGIIVYHSEQRNNIGYGIYLDIVVVTPFSFRSVLVIGVQIDNGAISKLLNASTIEKSFHCGIDTLIQQKIIKGKEEIQDFFAKKRKGRADTYFVAIIKALKDYSDYLINP